MQTRLQVIKPKMTDAFRSTTANHLPNPHQLMLSHAREIPCTQAHSAGNAYSSLLSDVSTILDISLDLYHRAPQSQMSEDHITPRHQSNGNPIIICSPRAQPSWKRGGKPLWKASIAGNLWVFPLSDVSAILDDSLDLCHHFYNLRCLRSPTIPRHQSNHISGILAHLELCHRGNAGKEPFQKLQSSALPAFSFAVRCFSHS